MTTLMLTFEGAMFPFSSLTVQFFLNIKILLAYIWKEIYYLWNAISFIRKYNNRNGDYK